MGISGLGAQIWELFVQGLPKGSILPHTCPGCSPSSCLVRRFRVSQDHAPALQGVFVAKRQHAIPEMS